MVLEVFTSAYNRYYGDIDFVDIFQDIWKPILYQRLLASDEITPHAGIKNSEVSNPEASFSRI